VLAVEPFILNLLGNPEKVKGPIPKEILGEQVSFMPQASYTTFGESVQDHIRVMTELFTALENVISEEDHVVYLLASLPESFKQATQAYSQ